MNHYQITKYNPEYRDENGAYTRDDWTSVSDTWSELDGIYTPSQEYLEIEQEYINSIMYTLKLNGIEEVELPNIAVDLRFKYKDLNFIETFKKIKSIYNGKTIAIKYLPSLIRFALRKEFGFNIVSPSVEVAFGDDYYMSVASKYKLTQKSLADTSPSLFVEPLKGRRYIFEDREDDEYRGVGELPLHYYSFKSKNILNNKDSFLPRNWMEQNGLKVPNDTYLKFENRMVELLPSLLHKESIKYLEMKDFVLHPQYEYIDLDFYKVCDVMGAMVDGQLVSTERLFGLVRLIMRGEVSCKLEAYNFFVHFQDTFHIYIGTTANTDVHNNENLCPDLIVKEELSPFLEESNYYEDHSAKWVYVPHYEDAD